MAYDEAPAKEVKIERLRGYQINFIDFEVDNASFSILADSIIMRILLHLLTGSFAQ